MMCKLKKISSFIIEALISLQESMLFVYSHYYCSRKFLSQWAQRFRIFLLGHLTPFGSLWSLVPFCWCEN